jgi:NADH-quinone oxidoreductase subunit C
MTDDAAPAEVTDDAAPAEVTDNAAPADGPDDAAGPARRHGAFVTWSRGQEVLHPDRSTYLDVVGALKDEGFELCADVCAVDYYERPPRDLPAEVAPERFEVVVSLLSLSPVARVRVRVQVPETDPHIPTLFSLYPGSEAMEREAYDLMGVLFDGHPDMTRILMPDDWEGHPLRKDYAQGRIPVQFKAAPSTR